MATKFLAFLVLRFERCCPKQNTVAAESQNIWLKIFFQAGYTTACGPALKIPLA